MKPALSLARAVPAVMLLLLLVPAASLHAQDARFDNYSVQPFANVEPQFASNPRQTFRLSLAGVGREPLTNIAVTINGQPLREGAWRLALSTLIITPDRDLQAGLNEITLAYEHPGDAKRAASGGAITRTFFANYQAAATPVRFGKRGELLVGGSPRFVRGGYRSGQEDRFTDALPSAVDAGLNMVHDYRFETYDAAGAGVDGFLKDARAYLRRARELKLGVFLGLPRTAVRQFDERTLATIVAELSGEPALWMWYIYDEPTDKVVSSSAISRTYDLLRRLDPNHPAIVLTNRVETMYQYYPFCDVLWYDRYPIIATSDALVSLAPIAAALQISRQTVTPGKPVWPVLQLQDNRGSPDLRKKATLMAMPGNGNYHPNEAEIRAQAHLAIGEGAMAVVYYWASQSWYSMKTDTPQAWSSFSKVMHELQQLEPVLLSDQAVPEIAFSGGHNKLVSWVRKYGSDVYVGVVNASVHASADVVIKTPAGMGPAQTRFGDAKVESRKDGALVKLAGAGTAVISFPQ